MKIRRTAWHFRMYTFLISLWSEGPDVVKGHRTSHTPRDLCHYFWTIVLMVIAFPLWSVIATVACIVFIIALAVYWVWVVVLVPPARKLWAWMCRQDSKNSAARKERAEARGPKQPSLVKTYVKARKQKVCPMIEIVD